MKRFLQLLVLYLCVSGPIWGFEPFVVSDLRVDGLQRISAGTVFTYLPIKVGDLIDNEQAAEGIRALFKTGFFKDIRLRQEDRVLVVELSERAAIAKIELDGNKALDEKQLLSRLKELGMAEGRVFNRSMLDRIEQELHQVYFSQGQYGAKIETKITPLERNRIAVVIEIIEGAAAKIRTLHIVGNHQVSEKTLLGLFQLKTTNWLSFYNNDDRYSKQKLSADLESLRSYYLDRGYISFKINSTLVAISPDKKDIYITINLNEGQIYRISEVKLAGELVVPPEELFPLIEVRQGAVFSRKQATRTSTNLSDRLGNEGYAFANINSIPKIDEASRSVSLTFFVDPGRRAYVHRINMRGNTKTRDEVLRREMRQMESGWISTEKVTRSRIRLQRLGYFEDVSVETIPVPDTTDQVDVNFTVVEKPSGNLLAGIGFSQTQGLLLNASVSQNNFLGTGKQVSFSFNNSDVSTEYSFGFTNPYYTLDGISRGFQIRFRESDASQNNISDFLTDTLVVGTNLGIPINEFDRLRLGLDLESTTIRSTNRSSDEIQEFLVDNGDSFDALKLSITWAHDTRNRAVFPDRGQLQRLTGLFAIPGSDLEYFKLSYRHQLYYPLARKLTLKFNSDIAFGGGYGNTSDLPFFEHFFAGGTRSVRGFDDNTLGPRDSNNDPLGGDLKLVGNLELIFPPPFGLDTKSLRLSAFVDAGSVFADNQDFEPGDIRYSTGVAVLWLSPVGALTFSLAQPLNDQDDDDVQIFQFSFGAAL